jgi:toxin HigB-1
MATIITSYVTIYHMIKSFIHKGVEAFFLRGSKAGIRAVHARRLQILLTLLDAASNPKQMDAPGFNLHALKGDLKGHWAVSVNGNWRLTFRFEGANAILVDYQDYH